MSTTKSFIKGFIALVKGDDVTAQAEKAFRQSQSALKVQISSLDGDTIAFEDKVEDAKDKLSKARVNNGKVINDRDTYVRELLTAKNVVSDAQDALDTHLATIDFLKDSQAQNEKEEEDAPILG